MSASIWETMRGRAASRDKGMLARVIPGWALAAVVLIGQALAFITIVPLSLGPRVVLQPWLLQRGFLLYDQMGDEHTPLLALLLTLCQPLTADGVLLAKTVLVVLLATTTLLTFYAAVRAGGYAAGVVAAIFMALWSPHFGYGKLWHETLLAPLYLLILLQWRPGTRVRAEPGAALITGLLLGLAVAAKQYAGIVALGVACWHALAGWRNGRPARAILGELVAMAGAAVVPIALLAAYQVAAGGSLASMAYWTVSFALASDMVRLSLQWPTLAQISLLAPAYLLLLPFVARWLGARRMADKQWLREGLALILLLTGSLTIFPRFGLFHLQPALPILAWISGVTLMRLRRQLASDWPARALVLQTLLILAFGALWGVAGGRAYWNVLDRGQEPGIAEYSDLVPLAAELRSEIPSGETVYVMPDNEAVANLYYLLRAEPPHYWVPTSYPWFMTPDIRAKALLALQEEAPAWIVVVPDGWDFQSRGRPILDFVGANYEPVAQLPWNGGEVQLWHRRLTAYQR